VAVVLKSAAAAVRPQCNILSLGHPFLL
jgi:hypothetical protein